MAKSKQQKALEQINDLTTQARDLITQAEKIADENGVSFSFSVEYGMGGTYTPKKVEGVEREVDEWDESDEGGWNSSSSRC